MFVLSASGIASLSSLFFVAVRRLHAVPLQSTILFLFLPSGMAVWGARYFSSRDFAFARPTQKTVAFFCLNLMASLLLLSFWTAHGPVVVYASWTTVLGVVLL